MSSAAPADSPVDPPTKKRKLAATDMANNGAGVSRARIDEGLYSRQLYVLGHDAMFRMAGSDVLISGLGGLGAETAKNVILGGVKSVTLHDEALCTLADLSSQFYLTEADVGLNRAERCLDRLSELNTYVPVRCSTTPLTEDFVRKFSVVVLTDASLDEQLRISEFTHPNNIALIIADTHGVFAQVFCDFGPSFTVHDVNGEPAVSAMVADITSDKEAVVTCIDDARHGMEDGDYVTFSEVLGMTELNGCKPLRIKVLGPYTFSVGDTTAYTKYERGGIATQVKMPKTTQFKPLKESLANPEFVVTDFAKFDHPQQLHLAFHALHKFKTVHGRLPKAWSAEDASAFVTLAKSVSVDGGNDTEVNTSLLELFAKVCSGDLGPINATIGGIVAQEVMKACSGKFFPIYQWLYFDAIETLPIDAAEITEETAAPLGTRYDGQIAVFGNEFQKKIGNYLLSQSALFNLI